MKTTSGLGLVVLAGAVCLPEVSTFSFTEAAHVPACALGFCALTREEQYKHPALSFTYYHSDTLCAGWLEDCPSKTAHPTICTRTSLSSNRRHDHDRGGGIPQHNDPDSFNVPEEAVHFEVVGFVAFNKAYAGKFLGGCSFEDMVRKNCSDLHQSLSDQSSVFNYQYAVGYRSYEGRVQSGFQNQWTLDNGKVWHKMEGTIIEDYPGINYIGVKGTMNLGVEPLIERTSHVMFLTADDLRVNATMDDYWTADGKMHLRDRGATRMANVCVTDTVEDGQCIGNQRVLESGDYMYSFFNVISGGNGRLSMLDEMLGYTHAGVRMKMWANFDMDKSVSKVNGRSDWEDGEPVTNVSVPTSSGWLHYTMPPKYNYGVLGGDGRFYPKGTRDVTVYCSLLYDGDQPIMYFDFAYEIDDANDDLEYVTYSFTVTSTANDDDDDNNATASSVPPAVATSTTVSPAADTVPTTLEDGCLDGLYYMNFYSWGSAVSSHLSSSTCVVFLGVVMTRMLLQA